MYIHISNLNSDIKREDILKLLKNFDSVTSCVIHHIRDAMTRATKTYALVDISNMLEVVAAIKLLNGSLLGGQKLLVQLGG